MVAGERFEGCGLHFRGSWGHFGGLGAVLEGIGARIEGSVALLDANMAEKSNKSAKKVVSVNVTHPLGEGNWRQEAAQGGPKGSQMEAKWE